MPDGSANQTIDTAEAAKTAAPKAAASSAKATAKTDSDSAPAGAFDFAGVQSLHGDAVEAISHASGAALHAFADAQNSMMDFASTRVSANLETMRKLMSARTPDQVFKCQSEFYAQLMDAYGDFASAMMHRAAEATKKNGAASK